MQSIEQRVPLFLEDYLSRRRNNLFAREYVMLGSASSTASFPMVFLCFAPFKLSVTISVLQALLHEIVARMEKIFYMKVVLRESSTQLLKKF